MKGYKRFRSVQAYRRMTRGGLKGRRGGEAWVMRKKAQSSRAGTWSASRTLNPRIGGFLGIELKFYDQKLLGSALTAPTDASGGEHDPSATVMLNTVVQGDGESQRDGRKITMKSIYIDGLIKTAPQATQSAADNQCLIFIALVLDTQCNGATISSENVYVNPGASAVTAANPLRNLQFTKRFKVLATRRFIMQNPALANDTGATGGVIQNGLSKRFKIFKNLHNIQSTYSASTETVANITDNCLHIVSWTSDTSMAPQMSYVSRLRFVG